MAINTSPIFTRIPNCPGVVINAANTAGDGSGALFTVFTAASDNSLLLKVVFTAAQATVGASALKVMRVYMTDTSGANPIKIGEILLPLITGSNTVIGATATFTFTDGLPLKSGQIIKVSQSIYASAADQTHAYAVGGDYTV
jgi:hypothetical protein